MKTVDELVAFANTQETGMAYFGCVTYREDELRAIAKCLVELPKNSRVVEIGTWAGRSASLYLQLQKDLDLDIHLVDSCIYFTDFAVSTFKKMISDHFSDVPFTFHKTTSQQLGSAWNLPIDFIHVDGCHDYNEVYEDCRLWLPHLVSKGMAAFNDSTGEAPGVVQTLHAFVTPTWTHLETAGRVTTWRKP